jgi:adenosylcobyric acid synthase
VTAAIMLQGTGSDVGKSLLVAGLCRLLANAGHRVAPFKPQNMSNNAAVTADGGEIGRAQWLQALAARRAPTVHMNPVLLKPQSDVGSQVVCQGRVWGQAGARDYQARRAMLLDVVRDSYRRVAEGADIVVIEGAGSAAEVNLRAGDIANMGFARAAGVPVVLVADIDRGGVIANLVGTHAVLDPADRALVGGFIINKFRGDPRLFDDGLRAIGARTGWPSLGVVPMLPEAARLPAEDAVVLERGRPPDRGRLKIAAPMLMRIANFDDLDPLQAEPDVAVDIVPPGRPLPGDADMVVLLGTKATIADLRFLRQQGWDVDLHAHVRRGGRVLGLCGGYQMLGRRVRDPDGVEGPPGSTAEGLGYLDVETVLAPAKTTRTVTAVTPDGACGLDGYEIHAGHTYGPGTAWPMLRVPNGASAPGRPEGAVSADGRVRGCYLHGLFASDPYRRRLLAELGHNGSETNYRAGVEAALDAVAARLGEVLDVPGLLRLARAGALTE